MRVISTIVFGTGLAAAAYVVIGIALLLVMTFKPHWLPDWFPDF